ncbi:hypothetical protein Aperf_G00000014103 [Anoplocephala perfoliata]
MSDAVDDCDRASNSTARVSLRWLWSEEGWSTLQYILLRCMRVDPGSVYSRGNKRRESEAPTAAPAAVGYLTPYGRVPSLDILINVAKCTLYIALLLVVVVEEEEEEGEKGSISPAFVGMLGTGCHKETAGLASGGSLVGTEASVMPVCHALSSERQSSPF